MERLLSKLPPLKSLVAFEAVMRLGTITAAAKELTSSQPAVSHHIKQLELNLGRVLFLRHGRIIKPTHLAIEYYQIINQSLLTIASQSEVMRAGRSQAEQTLKIYCNVGLANLWLLPLLPNLERDFPQVKFNISCVDIQHSNESNSLVLNSGAFDSDKKVPLWHEYVYPICSQKYATRHGLSEDTDIKELLSHRLIHMDNSESRWINWPQFLKASNIEDEIDDNKILFGNYHSVLTCVLENQGIALGWHGVVNHLLAKKKIMRITKASVTREKFGYYLDITNAGNDVSLELAEDLISHAKKLQPINS